MSLNADKLSLQTKLHIGSTPSHSDFEVQGSVAYDIQTVSGNTLLSGNSYIFANSSQGNLTLELPKPDDFQGRIYHIKKASPLNDIFLIGGPFDSLDHLRLGTSSSLHGKVSLQSFSGNWHIMGLSGNTQEIGSSNLIAWYRLEETSGTTVSNTKSSGFSGTLTNTTLITASSRGISGNGISLSSVSEYVNMGDNFNYTDNFTLSCWVKLTSTSGRICSKRSGSNGIDIYIQGGRIGYYDGTVNLGASSINDGQWHQVTVVVDEASSAIYINGEVYRTFTPSITLAGTDFYIGRYGGSYFDGDMDDFRVYDTALSSCDVAALAQHRVE